MHTLPVILEDIVIDRQNACFIYIMHCFMYFFSVYLHLGLLSPSENQTLHIRKCCKLLHCNFCISKFNVDGYL